MNIGLTIKNTGCLSFEWKCWNRWPHPRGLVLLLISIISIISGSCAFNRIDIVPRYRLVSNIQFAIQDHLVLVFESADKQPVFVLYPVDKKLSAEFTVRQIPKGGKIKLNLEEIPDSLRFERFIFPKTSRVDPNNYEDMVFEIGHRGKVYAYFDTKTGQLLGKCYYASNLFVLDYLSPLLFEIAPAGKYPIQK